MIDQVITKHTDDSGSEVKTEAEGFASGGSPVHTYVFVCRNPACLGYMKARTESGEEVQGLIEDKGAVSCCGDAVAYIKEGRLTLPERVKNTTEISGSPVTVTCPACGKKIYFSDEPKGVL